MRFHLDENVNSAVADGLRRRGVDVTATSEAGLIAASDEVQLEFALSQKRVIFTQDDDFLRLHQAGANHAGIAYCIKESRSTGEIIRGLILIWEVLEPEEMQGRLEYL
ncbi:DUF5615 family PIN-like protein [Kamptonema formosum]|uniref:DUF5615 family PIN-like protein n=1 Tax=Kamptonema formosum TaxID=331992 RepID=UPI0004769908|nr:DUF5615 family PIN-like protein [Oscillatoria sp. PCC 10802]